MKMTVQGIVDVPTQIQPTRRITFLDGLRGLAILLVIVYHAFARWPELVPYGSTYAETFPFSGGLLGVQLFFMISGYVILMTLHRSRSLIDFLWRRLIRLFPALLVATVIIFATAHFFFERPAGIPALADTLPGLLFMSPKLATKIFGHQFGQFEGVFWSLFVETKFYLIFGTAYFLAGQRRALLCLLALSILGIACLCSGSEGLKTFAEFIGFRQYPWFLTGALVFVWQTNNRQDIKWCILLMALIAPVVASLGQEWTISIWICAYGVAAIFLLPFWSNAARIVLERPELVFVGWLSYPLYLLHENMMISIIIKTSQIAPWIPALLLPIPAICAIMALAGFITKFVEPAIQGLMKNLPSAFPVKLQHKFP